MLHRILPYPCFLMDDMHLRSTTSRRRGIPSRNALARSSRLGECLGAVKYVGKLSDFMGRRWWRAGVEEVVFRLAQDDPASLDLLHSQLLVRWHPDLFLFFPDDNAFPVMDADFKTKGW